MNTVVDGLVAKMGEIEQHLAGEHGDFFLFGLFQREGNWDRWDVVVSAPWIRRSHSADLRLVTDPIQTRLTRRELLSIVAVFPIYEEDPRRDEFRRLPHVEHGLVELGPITLLEMDYHRVILITNR